MLKTDILVLTILKKKCLELFGAGIIKAMLLRL